LAVPEQYLSALEYAAHPDGMKSELPEIFWTPRFSMESVDFVRFDQTRMGPNVAEWESIVLKFV
jgi:hypothetical protein